MRIRDTESVHTDPDPGVGVGGRLRGGGRRRGRQRRGGEVGGRGVVCRKR